MNQSLTEVSAQSGGTVVHSELDEGVQEVSVQVGELLTWTHLLQVVRGNNQEVTEGVERVEELQHQRDLEDRQAHTPIRPPYYSTREAVMTKYINSLLYLLV